MTVWCKILTLTCSKQHYMKGLQVVSKVNFILYCEHTFFYIYDSLTDGLDLLTYNSNIPPSVLLMPTLNSTLWDKVWKLQDGCSLFSEFPHKNKYHRFSHIDLRCYRSWIWTPLCSCGSVVFLLRNKSSSCVQPLNAARVSKGFTEPALWDNKTINENDKSRRQPFIDSKERLIKIS